MAIYYDFWSPWRAVRDDVFRLENGSVIVNCYDGGLYQLIDGELHLISETGDEN